MALLALLASRPISGRWQRAGVLSDLVGAVHRVRLTDTFWARRIETNRTVTIPFGFAKSEQEGRMRNFERAAHRRAGAYEGKMPFDDTTSTS